MKAHINIAIDEGVVKEVDKWAGRFELSRSQMIQNLLSASLADVQMLRKLGFVSLASSIIKVQKRWKEDLRTD